MAGLSLEEVKDMLEAAWQEGYRDGTTDAQNDKYAFRWDDSDTKKGIDILLAKRAEALLKKRGPDDVRECLHCGWMYSKKFGPHLCAGGVTRDTHSGE